MFSVFSYSARSCHPAREKEKEKKGKSVRIESAFRMYALRLVSVEPKKRKGGRGKRSVQDSLFHYRLLPIKLRKGR